MVESYTKYGFFTDNLNADTLKATRRHLRDETKPHGVTSMNKRHEMPGVLYEKVGNEC